MKMKTLALLSLSLAVALGMPPFAPGAVQNPVSTEEDLSPLVGDWVPVQGHVVVENPAPQVRPGSEEENVAPVAVDMKQSLVEIKEKPQVGEEQEGGVKTEVKGAEVKTEPDVKAEPEVEQDGKENPEVKVKQELKAEPEVKVDLEAVVEPELNDDPDFMVEPDVEEEFHVQMNPEEENETGQEFEERHIDMEGKYEMVGEPIMELEPLEEDDTELSDVEKSLKAAFQNQDPAIQPQPEEEEEEEGLIRERVHVLDGEPIMELENSQVEPGEIEERKIDMERKYEMVGEPIMELEPLEDDNMELADMEKSSGKDPVNHPVPEEGGLLMSDVDYHEPIMELVPLDDDNTELSEVEKSLRAAFQNQDPAIQPLPEEGEEGLMRERDSVLDEEPIMDQQAMPNAAIMEEGPALDFMGEEMRSLEYYFPSEEARMGMERVKQQGTVEGSDYLKMEEPESEFVREEEFDPMFDEGVQTGVTRGKRALMRQGGKNPEERRLSPNQDKQGQRHCPGVILDGKCYQFFRGPKKAAEAEFFCQEQFAGGHLASITSPLIHREVMNLMLQQNGAYTRTWIGGLRFLETGRFIWLDGSRWSYADWLSGEPNNTADVEDCVEVLAFGNGKFNDFTCWEPQAFLCSYPYQ